MFKFPKVQISTYVLYSFNDEKIKPFVLLNRGGLTFQIGGCFLLLQEGILLKSTLVPGPGLWLGIIGSRAEERERERLQVYIHI